ncbi:MAG: circadian clock KaiB family protein [Desulfomonilaceae bacterium]|nr:circadian clock KaiB family protein [Desulfomonilaceae bacterium]
MSDQIDEKALKGIAKEAVRSSTPKYVLRLYVAGTSRKSSRAIQNLRKLLKEYGDEQYDVQVIDIYQQPIFAKDGQIVAAPTLVKELPPPLQRFIGDLSNTDRLLAALDLVPHKED